MSQQFHAIYENGVLRPLTPLQLPDSAEVVGTVEEKNGVGERVAPTPAELRQQQIALDEMFRQVETLPQIPRNDGLSGRDHDKILYGSEQ